MAMQFGESATVDTTPVAAQFWLLSISPAKIFKMESIGERAYLGLHAALTIQELILIEFLFQKKNKP